MQIEMRWYWYEISLDSTTAQYRYSLPVLAVLELSLGRLAGIVFFQYRAALLISLNLNVKLQQQKIFEEVYHKNL